MYYIPSSNAEYAVPSPCRMAESLSYLCLCLLVHACVRMHACCAHPRAEDSTVCWLCLKFCTRLEASTPMRHCTCSNLKVWPLHAVHATADASHGQLKDLSVSVHVSPDLNGFKACCNLSAGRLGPCLSSNVVMIVIVIIMIVICEL